MKRLVPAAFVLALASVAILIPAGTAGAAKSPALSEQGMEALFLLKHPRGLNRFVRAVSDPSSPRYRDYWTVQRLVKRYGAKPQARKRVLRWLAARGLEGEVGATGTFVVAKMPARRAARVLPRPAGASAADAVGPARPVPAGLRDAVTEIELLRPSPRASGGPVDGEGAATTSAKKGLYSSVLLHSGTASGCPAGSSGAIEAGLEPFTPNQFLTAYGHSAMHARGLRGQGQTIALVEIDGFRRSDIVAYDRCFGVKTPKIRTIPVGIPKPLPPGAETTLDLEVLTTAAPKVDRILVYEGFASASGIGLTAAAALGSPGNRPDVISISLGICEAELSGQIGARAVLDNVFAVAAGAGISVLVASGDTGSSGCRTSTPEGATTALPLRSVGIPASSPYVTAVGGTNLVLSRKNRLKREIVWNDQPFLAGGGTGGASILWRRPWWQAQIKRYGDARIVPDIAALADVFPGYAYFCTASECSSPPTAVPGWSSIGGTSAATPLMAAGVALANQYAERRRQPTIGFLNPLLYELGATAESRGGAFNDVTVGNDDIGRMLSPEAGGGFPLGCCRARSGYDWASGWGSLKVLGFAKLAAAAAR
jgi:kumamolisin